MAYVSCAQGCEAWAIDSGLGCGPMGLAFADCCGSVRQRGWCGDRLVVAVGNAREAGLTAFLGFCEGVAEAIDGLAGAWRGCCLASGTEVGLGYDEEHVRGKGREKSKGLWLA